MADLQVLTTRLTDGREWRSRHNTSDPAEAVRKHVRHCFGTVHFFEPVTAGSFIGRGRIMKGTNPEALTVVADNVRIDVQAILL